MNEALASTSGEVRELTEGVCRVLRAQFGSMPTVDAVQTLAPGHDAVVVAVRFAGNNLPEIYADFVVLRVFPIERLDHAQWEREVHAHLLRHGLAVPEIFDVLVVEQRVVQLMSRLPGRQMADLMVRRPWAVRSLADRLGELLASVHAVPVTGFPDHPWGTLLARRLAGGERTRHVQASVDRARELIEAADEHVAVHGDFHPLNVLVDRVGSRALLDWTDAGLAQPEADLARLETALDLAAEAAPTALQRLAVGAIRTRLPARVRSSYEARSGRRIQTELLSAWRVVHRVHDLSEVARQMPSPAHARSIALHLEALVCRDGASL